MSSYVKKAFGFSYDDRWYFVLSTFLFAVVYRLLAIIATRCVWSHTCDQLHIRALICGFVRTRCLVRFVNHLKR